MGGGGKVRGCGGGWEESERRWWGVGRGRARGGGGGESERLKAKKGRAEKTREGKKDGLERKLKKMES